MTGESIMQLVGVVNNKIGKVTNIGGGLSIQTNKKIKLKKMLMERTFFIISEYFSF